ncbi:hypothetical protein CLCR_06389 [Cladophialophora carrionii]|uniref:Uncharacterized protein n=1 Tax=Cladophialophora carrionii TaxID=86049 RepID=A0A1C1C7E9_9EURO|nr:hypothetical protein CLCR_06389 [Cladophialophora carrionii]
MFGPRKVTQPADRTVLVLKLQMVGQDERSIANRLATAEPQNDGTSGKALNAEARAGQTDATAPAKMHGNEPSRGAQIDKELQDEEAAILAKKDAAKGSKKPGGTGDVSGKKN